MTPEKIERSEAIVDLKTYKPKKYTLGRLAKAFDIPRQNVNRTLKRDAARKKKNQSV